MQNHILPEILPCSDYTVPSPLGHAKTKCRCTTRELCGSGHPGTGVQKDVINQG